MTNVDLKSIARAENPFASAFGIAGTVLFLLALTLLHVLELPLASFTLLVSAAALLWMTIRYPTTALGTVLALMSIYPLTFLLAKFFGPPYVASLEGCDRVVLLLLACILWKRNGVKLVAPDWFLLVCFVLALV